MSTAPLPDRGAAPGRDDGPTQLLVTDMTRSLGFYLDLGCEVRAAADGWALLHSAEACFVLLDAATPGPDWRARSRTGPPAADTARIRLRTPHLRALRRRLRASGVPTTAIIRPAHAPAGEIMITDPDQHLVVIEQLVPSALRASMRGPALAGRVQGGPGGRGVQVNGPP